MDGKSVVGKPLDQVVKLVRGKEGTTVKLTIKRGFQEKKLKIKRGKIHVKAWNIRRKTTLSI